MRIECEAIPPFMKNGFIVSCEETREAVYIDPGDEVPSLLSYAEHHGLAIRHILLTHAHIDHVTGVGAAKRALGVPIYLHQDDLVIYERAPETGAQFGVRIDPPPPVDVYYTPNQVIAFGAYEARPHHTPGHCPGGVCLQIGKGGAAAPDLFVGAPLFSASVSHTQLPVREYPPLGSSINRPPVAPCRHVAGLPAPA